MIEPDGTTETHTVWNTRWRNQVVEEINSLNMQARPGYPWRRLADTNAKFIALVGVDVIVDLVMERLQSLLTYNPAHMTPEMMVMHNLCDPICVFIKGELHTPEKIAEGRLRLIMTLSIIDQLVERLLFGPQNRAEIESWKTIPSMPGMGLHDEGLIVLSERFHAMAARAKEQGAELCEADVSTFDWSVIPWLLKMDLDVRKLCATKRPYSKWYFLASTRQQVLERCVLITSDGTLHEQLLPGIQKSGSYTTSSTNSRNRVMLALLAGSTEAVAMGDDSVEITHDIKDAASEYAKMGIKLKFFEARNYPEEKLEFCAHTHVGGQMAQPCRVPKIVASFLSRKPETLAEAMELWHALKRDLRHSSRMHWAFCVIVQAGWGTETGFPLNEMFLEYVQEQL
jgi:hypothetical protein